MDEKYQVSERASLKRQFAACIYELLSLIAIWLLCTFFFILMMGNAETQLNRLLLQLSLWLVSGTYLIACWVNIGQTLADQAWKIQLVNADQQLLNIKQALLRYVLATVSFLAFGVGYFWAILDKEHLFLHDRLLNTCFIKRPSK